MKGKDKCQILKEIRAQIAAANDIEWVTDNCTHKGECRGTCPKCEAELAALERALARRRTLGKRVVVAGLAAGMVVSTTSCALSDRWQTTDGGMLLPETTKADDFTNELDLDGVPVETEVEAFMGEPRTIYYYTDFTACALRIFETTRETYFNPVADSEGNESPDVTVPQGRRFEVMGETDERWLISYQGSYYCFLKGDLGKYACEVPAETDDNDEAVTAPSETVHLSEIGG